MRNFDPRELDHTRRKTTSTKTPSSSDSRRAAPKTNPISIRLRTRCFKNRTPGMFRAAHRDGYSKGIHGQHQRDGGGSTKALGCHRDIADSSRRLGKGKATAESLRFILFRSCSSGEWRGRRRGDQGRRGREVEATTTTWRSLGVSGAKSKILNYCTTNY